MEVMDPGETERERIGEEIDIYSAENMAKFVERFCRSEADSRTVIARRVHL